VRSAKAATLLCLVLVTGLGTWYLRITIPDSEWRRADVAGQRSLGEERFGEAERHFTLAIWTARGFRDPDPRLGLSLFHLAQALVGQSRDAEALPLLEQSALIQSKASGLEHPGVLQVRAYQTALLQKLSRVDDGYQAHRRHEPIEESVDQRPH
jgi:hypothetical protein